ncbi:MAG: hypothetical protein RL180_742 [Pseudomonadota bacterium]
MLNGMKKAKSDRLTWLWDGRLSGHMWHILVGPSGLEPETNRL